MLRDPYGKRYRLDRARGIDRSPVPAEQVRARVCTLLDAGYTSAAISRASGVTRRGLMDIAEGKTSTTRREVATRLLTVTHRSVIAASGDGDHVPRIGAQRRVQALLTLGWRIADIDRMAGTTLRVNLYGAGRSMIEGRIHRAVADVYDELWDREGPSLRTRTRAAKAGYAPPAAWDDDSIDDPMATPDLGEHQYSRSDVAEDVEWLLRTGVGWQAALVRLGRTSDGLDRTLRRAGRGDLVGALKAMDRREAS